MEHHRYLHHTIYDQTKSILQVRAACRLIVQELPPMIPMHTRGLTQRKSVLTSEGMRCSELPGVRILFLIIPLRIRCSRISSIMQKFHLTNIRKYPLSSNNIVGYVNSLEITHTKVVAIIEITLQTPQKQYARNSDD